MARRARLTIACLLRDRLVRVDCDRSGECGEPAVLEQPPVDPASALRALLSLQPPQPRVLVLLDNVSTQTIELAEAAVSGLSPVDLRRAIAHELEPVSGIPAANTRLALRDVDGAPAGRRAFWVVQLRADTAAAFEREIAAAGSRLLGITSTCGLGLANAIGVEDLRIEAWDHATFCGSLDAPERVIAGRVGQRYWTQAIEEWCKRHPDAALRWSGSVRAAVAGAAHVDDLGPLPALQDGARAGEWLTGIAPLLQNEHDELVPLIGPAPRPRRVRPFLVGLVLALAVAVGAWFDDWANHEELTAVRGRLDELRTQLQHREQQQKSDADLARRLDERVAANDTRAASQAEIDSLWQRERALIPKLLDAVAQVRPPGVLLRTLRTANAGQTEVTGIGTDTKVVDDFTAALATTLRACGWDVTPAHSREQKFEDGRTYHEFVTSLLPVAPVTAAPEPKPRRRSS